MILPTAAAEHYAFLSLTERSAASVSWKRPSLSMNKLAVTILLTR